MLQNLLTVTIMSKFLVCVFLHPIMYGTLSRGHRRSEPGRSVDANAFCINLGGFCLVSLWVPCRTIPLPKDAQTWCGSFFLSRRTADSEPHPNPIWLILFDQNVARSRGLAPCKLCACAFPKASWLFSFWQTVRFATHGWNDGLCSMVSKPQCP